MKNAMKVYYVADNIIDCYENITGRKVKSTKQLNQLMFIAYGLYASKHGKQLFENEFKNWTFPCVPQIQKDYGVFDRTGLGLGTMFQSQNRLSSVELEYIRRSVIIMSNNEEKTNRLLSLDNPFLPWKWNKNLIPKYVEIPFEIIKDFFSDENNLKILSGEKNEPQYSHTEENCDEFQELFSYMEQAMNKKFGESENIERS